MVNKEGADALIAMGFSIEDAQETLIQYENNVEEAACYLISRPFSQRGGLDLQTNMISLAGKPKKKRV